MSANRWIDWFIFTDNMEYEGAFNKVHFKKMDFFEMQNLVHNKIGTKLSSPYKICDYKPTFGVLFADYLKGYDFWGYCDLDAIYGDLSIIFTDELLKKYDKIFDQGHLSIYRNNDQINSAFKGNKRVHVDYEKILNSEAILVFDETYDSKHKGINGILENMGFSVYVDRTRYADLNRLRKNFYPLFLRNDRFYYFLYENGKLWLKITKDNQFSYELTYAHYQQKKNLGIFCKNMDSFCSVPKGFIDKDNLNEKSFYNPIDYQPILLLKIIAKRKYLKIKAKLKDFF
jgi:hypothetical protein